MGESRDKKKSADIFYVVTRTTSWIVLKNVKLAAIFGRSSSGNDNLGNHATLRDLGWYEQTATIK